MERRDIISLKMWLWYLLVSLLRVLSLGVLVVCFWIYIGMYGLDDLVLEFVAVVLVGNLVEVFAMIGVV